MYRRLVFAALAVAALACGLTFSEFNSSVLAQSSDLPTLGLGSPIGGFTSPVGITNAGDNSGRIFVVEQGGRIRIVKSGVLQPTPFLDISTRISSGGERGLLGLAFAPDYARRGHFYINYTNPAGNTVISRFRRSASNADAADPASEQIILTIAQPFANHNGGQLAFGRDGHLYVGMGDGGDAGDPGNRAQNPLQLLGKILRIDVETGRPYTYTSPASNPFFSRAGFRPEIWALGVRNPWRFSFDRLTADLFIADVGQGSLEEIDFQPASSLGGENYGWRIMEGTHCFNPNPCSTAGLTLPVVAYDHSAGNCSVTGGYVYRAGAFPRMRGLYFYGDFCSGRIWGLRNLNGSWTSTLLLDNAFQISAFGEDEAGNVYVAGYNTGQIFPLADNGPALPPAPMPSPATVHFQKSAFNSGEESGSNVVTVVRDGDTVPELFVDYATSDGTASERTDYTTARGTLRFAPGETQKLFQVLITDDLKAEGAEQFNLTLSNLHGAGVLGSPSTATFTITDLDNPNNTTNPVDVSDFFVRQHYRDFLNREGDAIGIAFWTNNIESCGANAGCRDAKRIDTSAAFFLSIEFQETGFFAYRVHKTAFGNLPGRPVPITFNDFIRDAQEIGFNVVVGQNGWEAVLDRNKQTYVDEFVSRDEFVAQYPTSQTPAQYVSALNTNAGFAISAAEEADLAGRLANGQETRATVLRKMAEDEDLRRAETNSAFVLMEYFGYLRRNPNDPPELNLDFGGFNFWLKKLNDNNGDYRRAEMVRAFISSDEYRNRFK
ncbi:MAG TPA: PQQ-dependent sugar dehydrogenase [Pyrinomonadaceae bacterium]|jgi:glucose/arabinose dehydrogenase|nr:PQQ-dependent sugar dehydrogenase [Pyrinomonadaceae bacterium]